MYCHDCEMRSLVRGRTQHKVFLELNPKAIFVPKWMQIGKGEDCCEFMIIRVLVIIN